MAFKDIFGFERARKDVYVRPQGSCARTLKTEEILGELARLPVHARHAVVEWHDTVEWGQGLPGSLRVVVSPLGSLRATVRKLVTDASGQPTWVCKRVYPLNLKEATEQDWVGTIHDELKKIGMEGQDAAEREFPNLDNFVRRLAGSVKQHAPEIFVFEGVRKGSEGNFIIYLSYRGQGVEAPGARRCEQFNINVCHRGDRGLLNVWGYEVSSPTSGHKWEVRPAEWNEYFATTQRPDEIITNVVNMLRAY